MLCNSWRAKGSGECGPRMLTWFAAIMYVGPKHCGCNDYGKQHSVRGHVCNEVLLLCHRQSDARMNGLPIQNQAITYIIAVWLVLQLLRRGSMCLQSLQPRFVYLSSQYCNSSRQVRNACQDYNSRGRMTTCVWQSEDSVRPNLNMLSKYSGWCSESCVYRTSIEQIED